MLFVITAITMLVRGLITPEVVTLALLAIPTSLVGNYCGQRFTENMRTEQYMRLLFLLLFIMGASLCWPALRMLIYLST